MIRVLCLPTLCADIFEQSGEILPGVSLVLSLRLRHQRKDREDLWLLI